ncbi:Maf family nucleotide pyrophosphatase [Pseudothermotoga sp.]|uniref:Maf family nucleotide pyrophosphatase n=1 Tax=Pseudothermotoga sp. TaxID=2033661 RepID=UPI0031F69C2A
MRKIVLASTSPRRIQILRTMVNEFEIVDPNIEEPNFTTPQETAEKLALMKATKVFEVRENAIVIAADTVVDLDGETIGKPASVDEAQQQLCKLMGKWHQVHTAVAIVSEHEVWMKLKSAKVKFREVSMDFVSFYASKFSSGKAGSYGLQDIGAVFVELIIGDPYVVIGLPIYDVWNYLYSRGLWCVEASRTYETCWI